MTEIPLTRGYVAVVDDEDLPLIAGMSWYAQPSRVGGLVYAASTRGGKNLRMHRLLLGCGPGDQVDHKDGDSLNNRRSNLRMATFGQNSANAKMRSDNTSGFKGVTRAKGPGRRSRPWNAQIHVRGRRFSLGYYPTAQLAAAAYDAAAVRFFGDFARTNAQIGSAG